MLANTIASTIHYTNQPTNHPIYQPPTHAPAIYVRLRLFKLFQFTVIQIQFPNHLYKDNGINQQFYSAHTYDKGVVPESARKMAKSRTAEGRATEAGQQQRRTPTVVGQDGQRQSQLVSRHSGRWRRRPGFKCFTESAHGLGNRPTAVLLQSHDPVRVDGQPQVTVAGS